MSATLQIKQLVDNILSNEVIKVEWDGKLIRCFINMNIVNPTPIVHKVAPQMELLKVLCNIQQIAPFSIIDCKDSK